VLRLLQRHEPGAHEPDAGARDAKDLSDDARCVSIRSRMCADGRVRTRTSSRGRACTRAFSDALPYESTGIEGRGPKK
jgi:hypothetical protein